MIVGGREFDETARSVERKMKTVEPEAIREHHIVVNGVAYPPKQVLATVTGWPRTTFTTMEAQRVLGKLGFAARRGQVSSPLASVGKAAKAAGEALEDRVSLLESGLAVANEAIAGLSRRVAQLEGAP